MADTVKKMMWQKWQKWQKVYGFCHFCQFCHNKKTRKEIIMAHYVPAEEFKELTGALSKRKEEKKLCVTRIKSVKDPLTGEVVGRGKKEIYVQYRRDYKYNPMTEGEQKQRNKWKEACRLAAVIIHDKNHPRYMELYQRWREHLNSGEPAKQFKNFICGVLAQE